MNPETCTRWTWGKLKAPTMNNADRDILAGVMLWTMRALIVALWWPVSVVLWERGNVLGVAVLAFLVLMCLAACRPSSPRG
jgi:hypothetical protein